MDVSSYVLLSHEQALRRRLDITANNLANMNTVGFKREKPVFHEYVEKTDSTVEPARTASFVLDYGAVHDTAQGGFQQTDNPLDVYIDGPGYLSVEDAEGNPAYTRAGFIKVLASGELATSGGERILGDNGKPIVVPPDQANGLSIANDGTVNGADGPLGRIAVTVFDNEATVTPRGDGLVTGTGGRVLAAGDTRLRSGGVEAPNVNPIVETTDMIDILRAYQTSQKISDSMADLRKRALDRLSKPGN
ncbi:MAG: flagellar hook-basal body complex protein [Pseudomonadota bacterium]